VSAFLDGNAGLLLVVASQFCFALSNISVKWLNNLEEHIPMLELVWVRMSMVYVFSVGYMCWQKIPNPFLGPKDVRPLLVARGLTGFTALSGMYFSLKYLSFSDAVVMKFIAPILTGFSGAMFLKERLSLNQICAGLCSFFGVILIARPRFLFGGLPDNGIDDVTPGQRMTSVTAALIGVLASTGSYTLLRAIGKRANALHVNAYFSSQCVLISAIGMRIFQIPPAIPTRVLPLVLIFLVGIFGSIGQTLLAMGFQREMASRGSLAMYTSVVFAVVLEFIVFRTTPTSLSIVGAIIIMGAAIYISLTKQTTARPANEQGSGATPAHGDDREAR